MAIRAVDVKDKDTTPLTHSSNVLTALVKEESLKTVPHTQVLIQDQKLDF